MKSHCRDGVYFCVCVKEREKRLEDVDVPLSKEEEGEGG